MEASARLPRGRHSLTRDEVDESQIVRLRRGTIEAVAEHGYAKTSVADIVQRAGVSRETFYRHHADKLECFLAAYDASAIEVLQEIAEAQMALPPEATLADRADVGIGCFLAALAADEARAQTFLVEVFAAGPRSFKRWVQTRTQFVDAVVEILGLTTDQQRFHVEAYLGAASSLVTQLVCDGRVDEGESLREPLARLARTLMTADGFEF
jgi:AcrR family transcriptional regulator